MTYRLREIFSVIPRCEVFADVGCDHGYIAKAMLDKGKCKHVYISDISKKCLEKAEKLLEKYIFDGKATAVVSDGFNALPYSDTALIAGMGGEEIVKILLSAPFLPENLILQPMKNCDKVRIQAVKCGYKIIDDYVFSCGGKFYDLIVLKKGKDSLTEDESEFGRGNLSERPKAFTDRLKTDINKLVGLIEEGRLCEADKASVNEKIKRLKKYI